MIAEKERLYVEPYTDGTTRGVAVLSVTGFVEFYSLSEILEEKDLLGILEAANGLWTLPHNFKKDYEELEIRYCKFCDKMIDQPESIRIDQEFTDDVIREVFNDLVAVLPDYIYLDDSRIYMLLACFVIFSFFKDQFSYSPRIMLDAEYGAGKSTILDVMAYCTYRGHKSFKYTPPALITSISNYGVTALLDEGSKNLRNKDNGAELALMLIGGFSRNDARSVKMVGHDFTKVLSQNSFTATMCAMLDESPTDLIDRSIILPLIKSQNVVRLKKVGEVRLGETEEWDDLGNPKPTLERIASRLYALLMLSKSLSVRNLGTQIGKGVVFEPFYQKAKRYLETSSETDTSGNRYAYGDLYCFQETPVISGRTEDVILPFYTIAFPPMEDRTLLELLIDLYINVPDDFESTEATLIQAIKNQVELRIKESRLRSEIDPPPWSEVRAALIKISTTDLHEEYRTIRIDRDGWDHYDIESAKTLTAKIRRMKLKYHTGAGNKSYFDPDEPNFKKAFCSAIRSKGTAPIKKFFGKVLREC